MQSAVSDFDGLKLGQEVKTGATMSGATRPSLTSPQSFWEQWKSNERKSFAADQAAESQARPRSPTLTATGLDAELAAMRVPESSM